MKRLFVVVALLFSAGIARAATPYWDLEQYTVVTDTINVTNDYQMRGTFALYNDTYTPVLADCTSYMKFSVVDTSPTVTISNPMIITGNYLHIGDGGTISYADGSGDLFIEDELEVEGVAVFKALCRVTGGFQLGNFNDAAILLIDPNGIGEVYMSSEHSGIFVSTGTAAGEFGYIATTDLP